MPTRCTKIVNRWSRYEIDVDRSFCLIEFEITEVCILLFIGWFLSVYSDLEFETSMCSISVIKSVIEMVFCKIECQSKGIWMASNSPSWLKCWVKWGTFLYSNLSKNPLMKIYILEIICMLVSLNQWMMYIIVWDRDMIVECCNYGSE